MIFLKSLLLTCQNKFRYEIWKILHSILGKLIVNSRKKKFCLSIFEMLLQNFLADFWKGVKYFFVGWATAILYFVQCKMRGVGKIHRQVDFVHLMGVQNLYLRPPAEVWFFYFTFQAIWVKIISSRKMEMILWAMK